MGTAFYLAGFVLQWESAGRWGSARHYIPRSPSRKALMEDGLSEGGSGRQEPGTPRGARRRRGPRPPPGPEPGRRGAVPPHRDPAASYGRGSRDPRGWALSGGPPPRPQRRPSWPGGARGCQPPPRRYRPRTGAAAVQAICSGQLTPAPFRGGKRAREPGLREGRGAGAASSSPWRCLGVEGRQAEAVTPGAHRWAAGTGDSGSILRDGAAQCLSSARRERSGRGETRLSAGPCPSRFQFPPPPRFALPSRGDPAVGARVRAAAAAGGAARTSGRAPCPATRALSRVEKPRARAPRPPLPAAFPLRLFDDFLPEKKKN